MQNIAIIQQGTGRYLFSVPENVALKEGDRVKCSTKRGITDGIAFADSAWVDENISQLIGKLTGAKFPLKSVVGKMEYQPFEKPQDKPAANPANKYEGMSNKELYLEMCVKKGACRAINSSHRKNDCPLRGMESCGITDANRAEVIKYLHSEDAEAAPKPEGKPTKDTPFDCDEFKAGKVAVHCDTEEKAKAFLKECEERGYKWSSGHCLSSYTIWEYNEGNTCYIFGASGIEYANVGYYERNGYTIIDYPFSEKPEQPTKPDKQEPIKLYCVEDCPGPCGVSKGKIYNFDGGIEYDNANHQREYDSYEQWKRCNKPYSDVLFPLVKRPAKVGEWVLLDKDDCFHKSKQGDVVKVVDTPSYMTTRCFISDPTREYSGGICVCFEYDYTYVLDGYHPAPEAEPEPEPEYWNGKVVCVSSGDECFTVGKMYEFVNGKIKDDEGDERPVCYDQQFKSVEEWNSECGMPIARFIEYKGEAHD